MMSTAYSTPSVAAVSSDDNVEGLAGYTVANNYWNGRAEDQQQFEPLLTSFPVKMEGGVNANEGERGTVQSIDAISGSDFIHDQSRSNSPTGGGGGGFGDQSNEKVCPITGSKQDSKICGVCGDRALGNNFNAITCESCKAFFRRNALKTKEFICPFNDNCKVDPVTRRFCQKCRLKKCFDIGMKKEWIMTDEEKKMKKSKIEQNRLKRQSSDNVISPYSSTSTAIATGTDDGVSMSKIPYLASTSDNSNSNPSTPGGAVSLIMACSPTAVPSANSYPSHIQTPSPPDPTLPYTKGSKVAMTPTSRVHFQHSMYTDGSTNASSIDGTGFSGLLTTGSNTQRHPTLSIITMANSQRKLSNPNSVLCVQDPEHHVWCSGESSSSSSSSVPYSSPNTTAGSHQTHGSPLEQQLHSGVSGFSDQGQHQGGTSTQINKLGGNYKLLTSLIRPGITESPPDAELIDCSSSNINAKDLDDYSVIKQISTLESKLSDDDASSEEFQFTLSQAPDPQHAYQQHQHLAEEDSSQPLPLNTMDSILSVAIKAEFNAFGVLGRPHCGFQSSRELNSSERAKLNELLLASEALNAPVDAEGPVKGSEGTDHSLINVINLTDIAIRRLIKMSKKISGFKNMCQDDQIALLKGGCTEMMILRSVVTYDPDRDSWNIPHSNLKYNIKVGVLKEARGNLYEEHQRFAKSFKSSWRLDENIMIILGAITLFTPERPNVIHKDVVKLEQDSYYYLLKRYLESTVNGCEARSTYLQLIGKIAELHNLNYNHLRVFLEVNPREVEPLLIEIFDLK